MIAALFVATGGPYFRLPDVDPWDQVREARNYQGPWPVVAHPPCERWGRYWGGGPSARTRRAKGDDGGCFLAALEAVRRFGGVLEHPEASHAWSAFELRKPSYNGGWVPADEFDGWTCCVAQGHYGHPAQKMTWLYVVGTDRPELTWGRAPGRTTTENGFHSAAERAQARRTGEATGHVLRSREQGRITAKQRLHTPEPFRDLLLHLAETVASQPSRVAPQQPPRT